MLKKWVLTILITLMIFGVTTGLFLYSSGYRIDKNPGKKIDFKKTGMIGAKSIPEGAKVYLDGELVTATNGTISGIDPGTHALKIIKNGFAVWEKQINVFAELVTDITAVLVSQSPRLEPLTNTGASFPSISPSLTKLAYFTKDGNSPGVWAIPLQGGLSLFRTTPQAALEDITGAVYSDGESIEWSPDENKLLVGGSKNTIAEITPFYIVNLATNTTESTSSPDLIRSDWAQVLHKKRQDFIDKLDIPVALREIAVSPETAWAHDDKKFLYTVRKDNLIEYRVYNMEKPLPVGEKVDSAVFTTNISDVQPKVTWYSDSFHLILVEDFDDAAKKGRISLIRIDGTNKVEIYNGALYSDNVYSAPGGDKLIILTGFKSNGQTDLYTLGIR